MTFSRRPGERFNRGRIASSTVPPLAIPEAFSSGGLWDFSGFAGNQGDAVSGDISSLAGSNTLTATSSPIIDVTAIGGNRGLKFIDTGVANTQPCVLNHALAAYVGAGQPFGIVLDFRANKQAQMPLVDVLHNATTDEIGLLSITQKVCIRYRSATSVGLQTISGTLAFDYDYNRVYLSYDGTSLSLWVNRTQDPVTPIAVPNLPTTLNRFTVAASTSSTRYAGATGYMRRFGLRRAPFTQADVDALETWFQANDYTLPLASSPNILLAGDSIMQVSVGALQSAGMRGPFIDWLTTNRKSLRAIGQFTQGTIPNRLTSAQGGANILTIQGNAVNAINTAGFSPRLTIGMGGTNDVHTRTPAQLSADILTALNAIQAAGEAKYSGHRIAWSTITPINPAVTPDEGNVVATNALLTGPGGIFDQFDAAHPGKELYRLDNFAAVGGAWGAGMFGADNSHPNEAGVQAIVAAWIPIIGAALSAISPT